MVIARRELPPVFSISTFPDRALRQVIPLLIAGRGPLRLFERVQNFSGFFFTAMFAIRDKLYGLLSC